MYFKCLLRSILVRIVLRKLSQRQRRSRRRELLTGSEKDVTITDPTAEGHKGLFLRSSPSADYRGHLFQVLSRAASTFGDHGLIVIIRKMYSVRLLSAASISFQKAVSMSGLTEMFWEVTLPRRPQRSLRKIFTIY